MVGFNMNQLVKQAQQMQKKVDEFQNKLSDFRIEGNSGGGAVNIVLDGKGHAISVKLDPSLLNPEEVEILEDLIIAAINNAKNNTESEISKKMDELTGGMKLPPGFNLFGA